MNTLCYEARMRTASQTVRMLSYLLTTGSDRPTVFSGKRVNTTKMLRNVADGL